MDGWINGWLDCLVGWLRMDGWLVGWLRMIGLVRCGFGELNKPPNKVCAMSKQRQGKYEAQLTSWKNSAKDDKLEK